MSITDVAVATAVITEAATHKIYNDPMPTDDSQKLLTADHLVSLAQQAQAAGMINDAVNAVLAAAAQQPNAAPAPAPSAAPAAPPAAPPVPQQAPPPPPPPPSTVIIADTSGQQYSVEPGQVQQYLDAGYTLVGTDQPPAPEPEVEPAPAAPWDGYDTAKIPEIVETLTNLLRAGDPSASEKLGEVIAYEKAGKDRATLLKKLTELAENGVPTEPAPTPEPAPEPVATPAPPPAPAPTPDVAEAPDVDPTPPFQAPPAAPAPVTTQPTVVTPPPAPTGEALAEPLPGATQKASAAVAVEGLPVPAEIVGEPPAIPQSVEGLSDIDVRNLQVAFNACQARAGWLCTQHEGYANDAKLVADAAVEAYMKANGFEKGTTVTEKQALANQNSPEVQQARRVQHDHAEVARHYRTLRDLYQHTCERLSREQTARDNERSTTR